MSRPRETPRKIVRLRNFEKKMGQICRGLVIKKRRLRYHMSNLLVVVWEL